ncbi:hypothetical protein GGH94_004003 [Coemansia aciculifera]|uniref:Uncharacterized protein n=1 Tax=Coemansia aciculifera TaxID=417176 RepID=A0A9W8IIZ3_9FUNG|nr:hypothetical protein GGH94_004003 [Coemansia aciculifera]
MSPVTRRKSMRLAELADKEAESERPTPKQQQPPQQQPIQRDSVIGTVSGGRVTKPEPKARVVASRYMSAANPRKPVPSSKAGTRPTSTPANTSMGARARAGSVTSAASMGTIGANRGKANTTAAPRPVSRMASTSARRMAPIATAATPSAVSSRPRVPEVKSTETPVLMDRRASRRETRRETSARTGSLLDPHESTASAGANAGLYATYLQWQLIEARAQIQFDENKAAAAEELDRLSREAEHAKRLLVEEQRKLKLMQEYSALSSWLAANKQTLVDMGALVSSVREPYTKFSEQLKQTTRAMPISGVYFRDGESLVNDMQGFVDAVEHNFSGKSEQVQDVFRMASRMKQYYKGLAQEQDLVTECDRLKQSLEHTAVLAISSKLGNTSDSC